MRVEDSVFVFFFGNILAFLAFNYHWMGTKKSIKSKIVKLSIEALVRLMADCFKNEELFETEEIEHW